MTQSYTLPLTITWQDEAAEEVQKKGKRKRVLYLLPLPHLLRPYGSENGPDIHYSSDMNIRSFTTADWCDRSGVTHH
jgi:hypothetical protein